MSENPWEAANERERRERWTLEDYERHYGSVTDAEGYTWVRLVPAARIEAEDPALAAMDARGELHLVPVLGEAGE